MKRNTLTAWLLGIILIFSATSCFNGPIVKGSKNYITKNINNILVLNEDPQNYITKKKLIKKLIIKKLEL